MLKNGKIAVAQNPIFYHLNGALIYEPSAMPVFMKKPVFVAAFIETIFIKITPTVFKSCWCYFLSDQMDTHRTISLATFTAVVPCRVKTNGLAIDLKGRLHFFCQDFR